MYVTEKTLKPLLHLRPLVMLGSSGTLAMLRALGFESFVRASTVFLRLGLYRALQCFYAVFCDFRGAST